MIENFIIARSKDLFLEKLEAGEIPEDAVVLIQDTGSIWCRDTYYSGTYASSQDSIGDWDLDVVHGTGDSYTSVMSQYGVTNALKTYLPLSGGTISGTLTIKRSASVIRYTSAGETIFGWLGFDAENSPVMYQSDGATKHTLIHSGNIGSQSVSMATTTNRFKYLASSGNLNTVLAGGGFGRNYTDGMSSTFTNAPSGASFGTVLQLSVSGAVGTETLSGQLAWDVNHASTTDATRYLWWRAADTNGFTYSKWHKIAFTDSNVASATKLATARTIWGQSFDGTGNVSGALSGVTNINSALYLNSSGNVGIGTTSPAYKLDVSGEIRTQGHTRIAEGKALFLNHNATGLYISGSSINWHDASNAYTNSLVNFTATSATFVPAVTMNSTLSVATSVTINSVTLTQQASVLNIANTYGYAQIGPQNTSHCHIYTDMPSFYINKEMIVVGQVRASANATYSLGSSSYRWSTVYGVNGNFTGDVTISSDLVVVNNIISSQDRLTTPNVLSAGMFYITKDVLMKQPHYVCEANTNCTIYGNVIDNLVNTKKITILNKSTLLKITANTGMLLIKLTSSSITSTHVVSGTSITLPIGYIEIYFTHNGTTNVYIVKIYET